MENNLDFIVYMKYGMHTSESVQSILDRKNNEFIEAGMIFWGYGGSLCHPINQIHPFVEKAIKKNADIYLIMSRTSSSHFGEAIESKEYSSNKIDWIQMPNGIHVIGSKHAIACGEIKRCNFDLDLNSYSVGVGKSEGINLGGFIRDRVDKACGIMIGNDTPQKKFVNITLISRLIFPYAVFMNY